MQSIEGLPGLSGNPPIGTGVNRVNPAVKQKAEDARRAQEKARAAADRDDKIAAARNAPFARVPLWAFYLDITRRQMLVLGRIYSFQCSRSKDGSPGEYRMSLAVGAEELCFYDRKELRADLKQLLARGFIVKRSNGARKPATYMVDEAVCVTEARSNGWTAAR